MHRVLTISQPEIRVEITDLAIQLKKLYPELDITFRYHPIKDLSSNQRNMLKNINIKIDAKKNVYISISKAKHIIGCFSTVLYETTGFKDKNILIFENKISLKNVDKNLGIWFKNAEELASISGKISSENTVKDAKELYFKQNAKFNFKKFIN